MNQVAQIEVLRQSHGQGAKSRFFNLAETNTIFQLRQNVALAQEYAQRSRKCDYMQMCSGTCRCALVTLSAR
jgi:radical SAM protein with 4Fe4S-binding SPASM domain